MATNPDFLKILIKDTTLVYPKLDQPYRFDPVKKQSEPCAPTAQGAAYSVQWDMTFEQAKSLSQQARTHYEACRARNPKLPPFADVFGRKKDDETKTARFTAKKNAVNKKGEINTPPRVVDAALRDLENRAIWTGSKGSVSIIAFPSTDPNDGRGGITFLLDAVQVTEPIYGGDRLEDTFGPPAGLESLPPSVPAAVAPVNPPAAPMRTPAAAEAADW